MSVRMILCFICRIYLWVSGLLYVRLRFPWQR